ncbi:MAG: VIT domain-containing protein, partial [Planctomycetota bacterium]
VKVEIVDGVADTRVTMVFHNKGPLPGQKILGFPLPRGAVADGIRMSVGGRLEEGEVLDDRKARRLYESIVRSRRDPALLEYVGRDLLRLRVFPIPPKGRQTVEIRFRQLLPESGGLHEFEFPARAAEGGSFAIEASIQSRKAIKNVYSPISGFDVALRDDHHARASLESKGRPKRDPLLFYGLSEKDFGLNLLTYRKKGQEGTFLLMLAPKREWRKESQLEKSITFVLDTSGSMQGKKIEQARGALRFFLGSLKKTDRFNVIPFSTEARPFRNAPIEASEAEVQEALVLADALEARGGTNIHDALTTALSTTPGEGLVPMVVFLTDGQPTVGTTDIKQILAACSAANRQGARIFVFGVGASVNTHLLDRLSRDSGGTRDYVTPGEDIEVKTSSLFEKLAHPVMTELELAADRIQWSRLAPSRLPDLFRGSRLVVAGRYSGEGHVALRLRGKVAGEVKEFVFDAEFPAEAKEHDFVATIWAQRRIGQLLDAIRLNGQNPELTAEIRRLGREHGIVTPYTSHLIVEEGRRVARAFGGGRAYRGPGDQVPRRGAGSQPGGSRPPAAGPSTPGVPGSPSSRVRRDLERAGVKAEPDTAGGAVSGSDDFALGRGIKGRMSKQKTGKQAVKDSKNAARLMFLSRLDRKGSGKLWTTQRIKGRLFHLVGGVWIDGGYKKELEKRLRKIEAFSDGYFELLQSHKELGPLLAFSTSIVIVLGPQEAVQILPKP